MKSPLYIFDFDDTLVDSGARVIIKRKSGEEELVTSRQYRDYEANLRQPGDTLDFSEFDVYPPDASIIKSIWSKMEAALKEHGSDRVIVLTARENPVPVQKFLADFGVSPMPKIEAVGSSDPKAKYVKALEYVEALDADIVYLWEDSPNNIVAIEQLKSDNVKVVSHLVNEGLLFSYVKNLLKEFTKS